MYRNSYLTPDGLRLPGFVELREESAPAKKAPPADDGCASHLLLFALSLKNAESADLRLVSAALFLAFLTCR